MLCWYTFLLTLLNIGENPYIFHPIALNYLFGGLVDEVQVSSSFWYCHYPFLVFLLPMLLFLQNLYGIILPSFSWDAITTCHLCLAQSGHILYSKEKGQSKSILPLTSGAELMYENAWEKRYGNGISCGATTGFCFCFVTVHDFELIYKIRLVFLLIILLSYQINLQIYMKLHIRLNLPIACNQCTLKQPVLLTVKQYNIAILILVSEV
jgi:hypothetical protein